MRSFSWNLGVLVLVILSVTLLPAKARAACASPYGEQADMVFNANPGVLTMQFCNGTSWIAMSGGGGAETDPQVGATTNAKWCRADGTKIECDQDAPGSGGDNLGNHTATQALGMAGFKITGLGSPTAGADAATKNYTDTTASTAATSAANAKFGTMTNTKWCRANAGGQVVCDQDTPGGSVSGTVTGAGYESTDENSNTYCNIIWGAMTCINFNSAVACPAGQTKRLIFFLSNSLKNYLCIRD